MILTSDTSDQHFNIKEPRTGYGDDCHNESFVPVPWVCAAQTNRALAI